MAPPRRSSWKGERSCQSACSIISLRQACCTSQLRRFGRPARHSRSMQLCRTARCAAATPPLLLPRAARCCWVPAHTPGCVSGSAAVRAAAQGSSSGNVDANHPGSGAAQQLAPADAAAPPARTLISSSVASRVKPPSHGLTQQLDARIGPGLALTELAYLVQGRCGCLPARGSVATFLLLCCAG
jgi:hypothetical protein